MGFSRTMRSVTRNFGYDLIKMKYAAGAGIMEAFPPGHFYSVVPSMSDLSGRSSEIFAKPSDLLGIELNLDSQIELLSQFHKLAEPIPFYAASKTKRFNIENDSFSYDDAPVLHYMLRILKPKRIIEIGSGCSSACMLDTNENYLNQDIEFTFIDIDCKNLRKNLAVADETRVTIYEEPIQTIDRTIFSQLEENDLLFVDSSHVMKAGSDLHTILFEILPRLAPGVHIHFHDIRFPFQYEKQMILKGVLWNEAYLLRAFLMYNAGFEISFWLNCLANLKSNEIKDSLNILPLADWDRRFKGGLGDFSAAGGSIYLRKK